MILRRMELALRQSAKLGITIVLKGAYSLVATPGGMAWFNSTGNPGMATAGSGDVLTGIITGLAAQGYIPEQAAIAGVYSAWVGRRSRSCGHIRARNDSLRYHVIPGRCFPAITISAPTDEL